ncbi:MAG TPA: thiamine phosphate synthase [Kofleriaceae bacterium]|nr:thiamine phosphate synthase [Kofleriaceae bacterium]
MIAKVVLITEPTLAWDDLVARVTAILAGVPRDTIAIQLRAKQLDGGAVLAMARALIATGVDVWINDRVDIALAAGAAGVHLPEHGLDVADVRALTTLPIGCSRHSVAAALECDADLIQLGPIFDTPGKRPIGLEPLGQVGRRARLVAVGGVDSEERASLAAAAGADAVAVIRAAWTTPDPVTTVRALVAGVEAGLASR